MVELEIVLIVIALCGNFIYILPFAELIFKMGSTEIFPERSSLMKYCYMLIGWFSILIVGGFYIFLRDGNIRPLIGYMLLAGFFLLPYIPIIALLFYKYIFIKTNKPLDVPSIVRHSLELSGFSYIEYPQNDNRSLIHPLATTSLNTALNIKSPAGDSYQLEISQMGGFAEGVWMVQCHPKRSKYLSPFIKVLHHSLRLAYEQYY